MRRRIVGVVLGVVLSLVGCSAEVNTPATRTGTKTVTVEPPAPPVPLSDRDRLSASPRHHEWADIQYGQRTVRTFVVFPETKGRAPAVVVIHENKGLTDWVRTVADRLAAEGYVALAPDMLSGTGPGGGGTEAYASEDDATKGIGKLPPEQVTNDLNAVCEHARGLPAMNGKLALGGFCWGGAQTFRFATNRPDLRAAYVFYGTAPDDEAALGRIAAPVHGFYAENDARVNATLGPTAERMGRLGKTFEPVTYKGAGHGFMRAGEAPNATPENRAARDAAWERWLGLLKKL